MLLIFSRSFLASLLIFGTVASHASSIDPTIPLLGSTLVPGPTWAELNPTERSALAPLAGKFDSLDSDQRRKWKAIAERFPGWTEEKRKTVQSRMLDWSNMTPEQRSNARQEALARRQGATTPETGESRSASWKRWNDLEEARKAELRSKVAPVPAQVQVPAVPFSR